MVLLGENVSSQHRQLSDIRQWYLKEWNDPSKSKLSTLRQTSKKLNDPVRYRNPLVSPFQALFCHPYRPMSFFFFWISVLSLRNVN